MERRFLQALIIFGIMFVLNMAALLTFNPNASTRDTSVAGADCIGCHGQTIFLPSGHTETKGRSLSNCRECHQPPNTSFRGKLPGSHLHGLAGIGCTDCHDHAIPADSINASQCQTCHGSHQKVAELTAHIIPNPHDSHHYGPTLDCNVCHQMHKKSYNFCNDCHLFEFIVP